ncbi:MAG: MBL fold metallo-hydrolase [Gammaproteobacteria bacterium]|nr:MBL fold metallo-hydrolase [Gammaproteobacteria bacterium]MCP5137334.1 MBL fold metallo-hydrolase [Gammaproteobacteria bacterium]
MVGVNHLEGISISLDDPTRIYATGGHQVFWLGITDETAFRCNTYLIKDGEQAVLFDPGSRRYFDQVRERVAQILPPTEITAMVISHQDPDIAASMIDWLDLNPMTKVLTTPRTNVLLPHYGRADYDYVDVTETGTFYFLSGAVLRFIESPFLHFPGAFTTYDTDSRYLFSSDIWAALDIDWELVVSDFDAHRSKMDLFHMDYMASNLAARGYVRSLEGLDIDAICPQHGSVIPSQYVAAALSYLRELRCGLDIVYADLEA